MKELTKKYIEEILKIQIEYHKTPEYLIEKEKEMIAEHEENIRCLSHLKENK